MAIMMKMDWKGIKPEQYESLLKTVNWEGKHPKGALFHVSAFNDEGLHVTDLWETPGEFDDFANNRLMPEVQKLGITSQPNIEIIPVHATFNPGLAKQ